MRLRHILPLVVLLLVAQAVIDAGPAIIAEREGGMGLGSALIGAYVMQSSGLVLGAILGGYVADRGTPAAAGLVGALLYYIGLMTTGMSPMGALASVMAGMGLAGVGHGLLLTAAFSAAAHVDGRSRVIAIAVLVAVPLMARAMVGSALAAGPAALVIGAGVVVALAAVFARSSLAERGRGAAVAAAQLPSHGSGRAATLGGAMLAVGLLLAIAGVEPSRLSAALVVGPFGAGSLGTLDAARLVMLGVGMALVLAGMATALGGRHATPHVWLPVAALALLVMAATGIGSAVTQAMTAGRLVEGAALLTAAVVPFAGVVGLTVAAASLARGVGPGGMAVAGSGLVVGGAALGLAVLTGQRPSTGDAAAVALIGLVGFGAALATTALRLALADVAPGARGLAAGAGVAAAGIGVSLGSMIGAGEGIAMLSGGVRGPAAGSSALLAAAVLAAVVTVGLLRVRSVGARAEWGAGR